VVFLNYPHQEAPKNALVFLVLFLVRFRAFLGKGSSKTPSKYFQKVHVKNLIQQNRQKFRCQVFLDLFLFHRGFGCFSAVGVQKQSQSFYPTIRPAIHNLFFNRFVLSRFLGVSR
jgi:hypothetical protein